MRKILFITLAVLSFGGWTAIKAQIQPDLFVRQIVITKDKSGLFVEKISVAVTNVCLESNAGASYVLVTFKTSGAKDAKAIYYIGNTVKALKGGETFIQTFDVKEKSIGADRHILVEADSYKKVTEANENNNWRTLNPTGTGALLSQGQCAPKI
jgi:subtilase family serine protease